MVLISKGRLVVKTTRFIKVDFERAALELKNNRKFQKANVTAKSGSVIRVVLCDCDCNPFLGYCITCSKGAALCVFAH